ncbi:hypothetical protein OpiT1DRAFT_06008 [Opitutaceae bacterium TAV1]|nr:hypothetical protein OpiT1DRAFT_06008 [Opitutaceae bacterium TAV1]
MNTRVIAGIAWFTKEQWPEYCCIMEDYVDETYEHWLRSAEKAERDCKKAGAVAVRVPMDLADFELWCLTRKKKKDAEACSAYAAEKVLQKKKA